MVAQASDRQASTWAATAGVDRKQTTHASSEMESPEELAAEPLGLAEARPPPYFRSVTRLRPSPQVELFE